MNCILNEFVKYSDMPIECCRNLILVPISEFSWFGSPGIHCIIPRPRDRHVITRFTKMIRQEIAGRSLGRGMRVQIDWCIEKEFLYDLEKAVFRCNYCFNFLQVLKPDYGAAIREDMLRGAITFNYVSLVRRQRNFRPNIIRGKFMKHYA